MMLQNAAITLTFCNKNVRQKYFTVCIIDTWNSLPHHIVNANSVNAFKNRSDKYLDIGLMKNYDTLIMPEAGSVNKYLIFSRSYCYTV